MAGSISRIEYLSLLLNFLFMVAKTSSMDSTPREMIKQWWFEKMSIKKPVKCTINPEYLQEFDPIAQRFLTIDQHLTLVKSHPCKPNETSKYIFKV